MEGLRPSKPPACSGFLAMAEDMFYPSLRAQRSNLCAAIVKEPRSKKVKKITVILEPRFIRANNLLGAASE